PCSFVEVLGPDGLRSFDLSQYRTSSVSLRPAQLIIDGGRLGHEKRLPPPERIDLGAQPAQISTQEDAAEASSGGIGSDARGGGRGAAHGRRAEARALDCGRCGSGGPWRRRAVCAIWAEQPDAHRRRNLGKEAELRRQRRLRLVPWRGGEALAQLAT